MSNETYFSLQGEIWMADRDPVTGLPGKTRWVFNVPKFEITLSVETDDVIESYSGNRLLDDQMDKSKNAKVAMTLHGWSLANLATGLYGASAKIASGSVVGEILPTALVNDDYIQLNRRGISNLVVTDSTTGTPLPVPAEKLSLFRPNSGIVRVIDKGAFVQPFKASYDYAEADLVTMFTQAAPPQRYVVFDGINTRTGAAVVCELYRVKFNPLSTLALINEAHGTIDLEGACLYDRMRSADPQLGGFGRFVQPGAAP